MRRFAVGLVALEFGLLILLGMDYPVPWQSVNTLLFGWTGFLLRVVPNVRIGWDGVETALVCLIGLAIGTHFFLRGFYDQLRTAIETPSPNRRRWSPRWTASLVALVVLMFVAGITATGMVHQVGWLVTSKRPLLDRRVVLWAGRTSSDNLKQIGMGLRGYVSVYEGFPSAPTEDEGGRAVHSWQTMILTYMWMIPGDIDMTKPWNHPSNAPFFRSLVAEYLNPEVGTIRNAEGFGLSHYSGNIQVFGRRLPSSMRSAPNGTSQLMLAGEVGGNYRPWGDPTNLRDPASGLNKVPDGFGSPSGTGAQFLFMDGSVRSFDNRTDPEILRALATPGP